MRGKNKICPSNEGQILFVKFFKFVNGVLSHRAGCGCGEIELVGFCPNNRVGDNFKNVFVVITGARFVTGLKIENFS